MKSQTKYHIGTLLLLGLLSGQQVRAQVSVEANIDSAQIFIGQRTGIRLEVSARKGSRVKMPAYDSLQQIVPGVEVMSQTPVDTEWVNDGKRMVLSRKYIVTSFDSALYYLPPLQVDVDGHLYKSKNLALKVLTIDLRGRKAEDFFPNKPVMAPPFAWEDYSALVWLSFCVLLLTVALLYVLVRLKDNKPIVRRIRVKKKTPPHTVAMQRIERIKEEKIAHLDDSKEYYTQLTDTLRQYIDERYGFNAMEMTSDEIIARLSEVDDPQAIEELKELFQTADLVKFAKYNTLVGERDRNLLSAIEFINTTKQTEELQTQPEEVVVVDTKARSTKHWLVASVTLASLLLLAAAAYLVYRIIMLNL